MAKKARVYDGTAWQELASAQTDLTAYSTTAQMNTAITAGVGLVLINTTTFSAASSVSLPTDTFTSTYENYQLQIFLTNSTAATIGQMRFRTAGVDNTTSNYFSSTLGLGSGGVASNTNAFGATSFSLNRFGGTALGAQLSLNISNLKTSSYTSYSGTGQGVDSASANYVTSVIGGAFNAGTSFDSLTIFPTAGTITGTIRVYGYKN